ncbi:MAG: hypothetical protein RIQ31_1026 [Actinomycetota bacterium]|jgi:hypothetical protein
MTPLQIEKQIKLYKLALILLASAKGITIAGFFQVLAMQSSNGDLSFSNALAGNGFFSPLETLIADLIAAPGMIWLYRSSKKLATLSPEGARTKYRAIWAFQQIIGTIVTAGAVVMIPGSLMAIQMLLPGFAVVFPIFAGAYLHLKARALNREMKVGGPTPVPTESPEEKSAQLPVAVVETSAGLIPMIVAIALFAINLVAEIAFFIEFRNDPELSTLGASMYPTSMYLGLVQVLDIFVISTISIVFFIVALRARRTYVKGRMRLISIFTVANLLIFPGAFAMPLATALGPSESAQALNVLRQESFETLTQIRSLELPAGFEMIDEFYSCVEAGCGYEVNSGWRTGVYNLDEPDMAGTCKAVIDYAINFGLDTYRAGDSGQPTPIGDGAEAASVCAELMAQYPVLEVQKVEVLSPTFTITGATNFGAESPLKLELNLLKYGEDWEKPNAWGYQFMIATTYEQDRDQNSGGLSQGSIEINNLLESFGQARLAAPDRNPTDPAFVQEVLDTLEYPINISVVETSPGVANRLDVTNSDGAHICLSIDPWDEEIMGSPDPGTGYGLGFMENLEVLAGFGNAVDGGC